METTEEEKVKVIEAIESADYIVVEVTRLNGKIAVIKKTITEKL